MCWFWFVIGFMIAIIGVFAIAYDDYIEIKGYSFDSEALGWGLAGLGGILAGIMLLANGISWIATV